MLKELEQYELAAKLAKSAMSNTIKEMVSANMEDIIQEAYIALKVNNDNKERAYTYINNKINSNKCQRGQWKIQTMEEITVQDEHNQYDEVDAIDAKDRILLSLKDILTHKEYLALLDCYNGYSVTESAKMRGVNKSTISRQLESARRKAQTIVIK